MKLVHYEKLKELLQVMLLDEIDSFYVNGKNYEFDLISILHRVNERIEDLGDEENER